MRYTHIFVSFPGSVMYLSKPHIMRN